MLQLFNILGKYIYFVFNIHYIFPVSYRQILNFLFCIIVILPYYMKNYFIHPKDLTRNVQKHEYLSNTTS